MGKVKTVLAAGVLGTSMMGGSAYAATNTSTFVVTMTIAASCNVVATPLAFIATDVFADRDAQSLVTATCAPGTVFSVGLDDGLNVSGVQRRMTDSTNFLNYELYTDSGRTTRWDDIGGTTVLGNDGSDLDGIVVFDVYGRVPTQASPPAGAYTDTVTVTVSF